MRNRWLTAFIRTIIFLAVAHVVFLILGMFFRTDIGMFSLPMIWAHWTDSWVDACISIVAAIVVYFVVYFKFSGNGISENE